MCLVRPMTPPTGEQLDMINDLNQHRTWQPFHQPYHQLLFFRVTQWLDTEITEQRLFEILQRARWTKPKRIFRPLFLRLDKAELYNYISKRGRGSMKRITQLFAVGMLLCLLAGCSNQASAPSSSPLSSASPSSEMSPTPALSPSAAVVVSPNVGQATSNPTQKPGQAKSTQKPGSVTAKATSNLLLPRRLKPRPNPPQRRRQNPLPIVTPPHAAAR